MSAASTIEINWSPVVIFKKMPVPTVEPTRLTRLFTQRRMTCVKLSIIPLATMAAPKHIAHRMSQMVFSMPAMPPVDTSSFSEALPVSTPVAP